LKAAEKIKNKLKNIDADSIKSTVSLLHSCNKKLKNLPLILFAVLYIFSGVDLLPETVFKVWLAYFDDVTVFIFTAVYLYCSRKGMVNENDRETNAEESIYSHIIRNGGGSDYNTLIIEGSGDYACNDNSDGNDDVCNNADAGGKDKNGKFEISRIIEEIESAEKGKSAEEAESIEENGQPKSSGQDKLSDIGKTKKKSVQKEKKSVFDRGHQKIKPKEEMFEEFFIESRSEELTAEEDEILW